MADKSTFAAAATVILAVAAGAVGVALAGGDDPPVETGAPDRGWFDPRPTGVPARAGEGRDDRGDYHVETFLNERGAICLELDDAAGTTGACGPQPTPDRPLGPTMTDVLHGGGDRKVIGVVDGGVRAIELETLGRKQRVATRKSSAGTRSFVLTVRGKSEAENARIRPLDEAGRPMSAAHPVSSPTP